MKATYFAPPATTERRKFKSQIEWISRNPLMTSLLTTMSGLLVVLNEDRQIVALNHAFLEALGFKDPEEALGLRLGQSLKCIHSHEEPSGCGTTPFCATCGAVIAMMAAIRDNRTDEQICAVTIEQNGIIENLCLLVRAQPIVIEDSRWILVFVQDITQQNFWINLERVFFHDIRNILGAITSSAEILKMDIPSTYKTSALLVDTIMKSAQRLNEEITIQNILAHEKTPGQFFRKARTPITEIREEIQLILSRHPLMEKRRVEWAWPENGVTLNTIPLLVSRVLGNMLVNAMEAGDEGDLVRLTAHISPDLVRFDVWNAQSIPPDIQLRVFQRHFSTKAGSGRGLGTYSMKLFGEKYLQGTVEFLSTKESGTTFSLILPR